MIVLPRRAIGGSDSDLVHGWVTAAVQHDVMRRIQVMSVGAVLVLTLAACGGSSSPSEADVDAQVDQAIDDAVDQFNDIADSMPEAPDDEPTTSSAPVEEAPLEPEAVEPRCAVKDGDDYADVACSEPHDAEFAGIVDPPEGKSPTDEEEFANALKVPCFDAVEALSGRAMNKFGLEVGGRTTDQPGATFAADVECWAEVTAEGTLSASLRETSLEEALGEYVLIGDMEPGSCFLLADEQQDSFDIGRVVDCDEQFAEMVLGVVTAEVGEYPGEDALRELGDTACGELADSVDFEVSGDTTGFILALEFEWTAREIRDFICTSYRSADYDAGPFCAISIDGGHDPAECDEPHDSEFVGTVPVPADVFPDVQEEAEALLKRACAPLVSEYLGGRDMTMPGIGVGFGADGALGEPMIGDVDCYVRAGSFDALSAAIADVGLDAALGDNVIVAELEPGTCLVYAADSLDVGTIATCDTPDAFMFIGSFTAEIDGPYAGLDELRVLRGQRCAEVLAESGLEPLIDVATLSGVIPGESNWLGLDQRTITCDAEPI